MRQAGIVRISAAVVATLLVLTACGDGDGAPAETAVVEGSEPSSEAQQEDPLYVVVTTTILGDIVKSLVGDDGQVEVLLPIGADPHDFQLSSQDGVKIREADLVVANGLGLEESFMAVFESAREDGARILEVGDLSDPMEWGEGRGGHEWGEGRGGHDEEEGDHDEEEGDHDEEDGDHDEEEGDHDEEEGDHGHEGAFDPHFWFDPSRMEKAVRLIAAELIEIGKGLSATEWNERATNYIAQIQDAAAEAEELLSAVSEDHRKLVTNHDSFSYFGAFFDFEILDTILSGGSTLAQPGTAHLAELVDQIRAEGVTVIFTETTADDGLPNTVAAEFDPPLQVVELYTGSLGPPGSGADTYLKWLVTNARLIAEAITS
ncbi:MAG: zinc ABC transporter substrate-binding protein [Actinomycetia bacterium]|nr:zinc ABC transporter substrate-binding protein [Actinomycetes bacterium]